MQNERHIYFPPFALDLTNECLRKGAQEIRLRPKAFAVLAHLLGRPGQLVTKEHLIAAVWQDTFVSEAVLKVAIRQIREALADDAKAPRFIETSHRRGYRFIGRIDTPMTDRTASGGSAALPASPAAPVPPVSPVSHDASLPSGIVGRDGALARMHRWLGRALHGERQVVFVTGEAGIGKTTLLDAFVRKVAAAHPGVRIGTGQCLEQYGMGEAYLPVLEAARQLCREHADVVDVLRAHAPMWLLQMPSLVTPSDRETFGREAFGATRERMLREMAEALDALTAQRPLVLVVEDLHWSDYSTLDLISYVARRRRPAHLMIVATYRPAELIASGHPLRAVKQELLAKRQCDELPLEYLSQRAVAQHLDARFPGHHFPPELATVIHERTEGNPLFMVNTIDYLVAARLIESGADGWQLTSAIDAVKVGVPDSIRHLIEAQFDRLEAADQLLLEAASVAGAEFSATAVAAALDETDVEARCEDLSRRHHFLRGSGIVVQPNGQTVGRYGFVHAVYRHVLYERVGAARRIQLHRRIAERGEALYGERVLEIAGELAMHFERAGHLERAAIYLGHAAHNAMRRSAYREAVALSRRGLTLLATLPDTDERAVHELSLHLTLGVPLIATEGYAAPPVGRVYVKARELCGRLGDTPEISQVLWGLWTFHVLRADLPAALEIAQEILVLADRCGYPGMAMRGHWAMEITCLHQGEFAASSEHFDRAIALYEPDRHRDDAFLYALDPGVAMRCFVGWALWFLGRAECGLERMREAVARARTLSEPHGLAHALAFIALLHQMRGDRAAARKDAEAVISLADEHGLMLYRAMGLIVRGWASAGSGKTADEAIAEIREGLAGWQTTGALLMRPHFLALLSEVLPPGGSDSEGVRVLNEAIALAESTGEGCYESELHRLKGERLRAVGGASVHEAEECFDRALAIARRQSAVAVELRVATSLAELLVDSGRGEQARDLLTPICERFVEGLDAIDVRNARQLLEALT